MAPVRCRSKLSKAEMALRVAQASATRTLSGAYMRYMRVKAHAAM